MSPVWAGRSNMNPLAFDILHTLDLQMPNVFDLGAALSAPPETRYYLRFSPSSDLCNSVTTAGALKDGRPLYQQYIAEGLLLGIEATYAPVAGGATLITPHLWYSEYVLGHPIALLRRGLCGARLLVNDDIPPRHDHAFQGWQATQGSGSAYTWAPLGIPDAIASQQRLMDVFALTPHSHDGILLEWMHIGDRLIFCDARDSGLSCLVAQIEQMFISGCDSLAWIPMEAEGLT